MHVGVVYFSYFPFYQTRIVCLGTARYQVLPEVIVVSQSSIVEELCISNSFYLFANRRSYKLDLIDL